jgi:hypothetical protein
MPRNARPGFSRLQGGDLLRLVEQLLRREALLRQSGEVHDVFGLATGRP